MEQIILYIGLFSIIVIIGQLFDKKAIPLSLLLIIAGMILSIIPNFPTVHLNSEVVLNIFLPVLIYQISTFASWKDVQSNIRPIISLSFGHVIFITLLVAITIHAIIPQLGWPLSFVIGAVISPPDSVAIVTIADKIRMPMRIVTILEGEGMLNDATALILFRFSLAAVITHEFSAVHAFSAFLCVVIGETIYGYLLGNLLGQIRLRINNPILHIMASILTPFLAYIPAEEMGGCGVIATVVTGFVIGHVYAVRFTPEFRLISRSVWPTLAFAVQNILFLLVGLDMLPIVKQISSIPINFLMIYSASVITVVILGRFFWVFMSGYVYQRIFYPRRKRQHWQALFVVSWSGMRGGISLAAALSVPPLMMTVDGANAESLLLFLIFSVIIATFLLQGLTLPWIIKLLGMQKYGQREKYNDHMMELNARLSILKSVLRWLSTYRKHITDDSKLLDQVKLYRREYQMLKRNLIARLGDHGNEEEHDEKTELINEVFLHTQIIEIERAALLQLWRTEKINLTVRNKLLDQLDHRSKDLPA
jgi:Na+/H+ antiporter